MKAYALTVGVAGGGLDLGEGAPSLRAHAHTHASDATHRGLFVVRLSPPGSVWARVASGKAMWGLGSSDLTLTMLLTTRLLNNTLTLVQPDGASQRRPTSSNMLLTGFRLASAPVSLLQVLRDEVMSFCLHCRRHRHLGSSQERNVERADVDTHE